MSTFVLLYTFGIACCTLRCSVRLPDLNLADRLKAEAFGCGVKCILNVILRRFGNKKERAYNSKSSSIERVFILIY